MGGFILVATRKGLFDVGYDGAPYPRCIGFLGDPVSAVLQNPHDSAIYAALNLGHFGAKLHRSDDFGESLAGASRSGLSARRGGRRATSLKFVWTLAPGGSGTAKAPLGRHAARRPLPLR